MLIKSSGLLELENSLPKSILEPQIKAPQKVPNEELYKKRANRLQRQLHEVYDVSYLLKICIEVS